MALSTQSDGPREPMVRLGRTLYLYQAKAPFVVSGQSVRGALEYWPSRDSLKCHECGKWKENLGGHVGIVHCMSSGDYRSKHGLLHDTPLVSEGMRNQSSQRFRDISRRSPSKFIDGRASGLAVMHQWGAANLVAANRQRAGLRMSYEKRNGRAICHAQLLYRVKRVRAILGHAPNSRELLEHGLHAGSLLYAFNLRSLIDFMGLVDMLGPENSSQINKPLLIEILRDFQARHGRLPSERDFGRRLPSKAEFIREFNSVYNAYSAAGLGIVAQQEVA